MTNDDLKRFYDTNAEPDRKKDFVRYGEDGSIITKHNATKNDEVVDYQTLIKHAGGAGADINYRGPWISGMAIHQYDVVYINNLKTRTYYMATNDIASSTTAPNVDTDNFITFLEVERDARLTSFPEAAEIYLDEMFQYIGETDTNFTNGYFYKCVREITYYTIVCTFVSSWNCVVSYFSHTFVEITVCKVCVCFTDILKHLIEIDFCSFWKARQSCISFNF